MKVAFRLSGTVLVALAVMACTPDDQAASSAQSPPEAVADPEMVEAPSIRLPVSLNEAMVALVDYSSEPLWLDAYEPPTTEEGWMMAEYNAYQMAIGGKVIQLAGTGPNDDGWVVEPDWIRLSNDMTAAGMLALKAAKARDVRALNIAGDDLVESCESCHKIYKPNLTSMGVYKSPNYPPRE